MGNQRQAGLSTPPRADLPTAAALVAAAVLPSLIAWLYFFALNRDGVPDLARKAISAAGKGMEVALLLAFVLFWERRRPRPSWPRMDGLVLGLGFGLIVAAGMLVLYFGWLRGSSLLRATATPLLGFLRNVGLDSLPGFLALAAFVTVANSLFEEVYFRWFIFGRMRGFLSLPAAVVLSALVFMAHHVILLIYYLPGQFLMGVLPLSLCIAVGGAMWAWLYARTDSLYAPWLSHAVIDAAILTIGWDLLQWAG
jgi:uncharacterized protein